MKLSSLPVLADDNLNADVVAHLRSTGRDVLVAREVLGPGADGTTVKVRVRLL